MIPQQAIDSSALTQKVTTWQAWQKLRTFSLVWKVGFYMLLFVLLVPTVLFFVLITSNHLNLGGGFFLLVLIGGSLYGLWDLMSEVRTSILLEKFAVSNGLIYTHDTVGENYAGSYFAQRRVRIPNAIRSPNQLFFELGNFRDVTDGQERSKSAPTYGFVRIKLPRNLPHMMLRSPSSRLPLPNDLLGSQTLHLEGDFDKYFTLYAPKEYERDALYIFTPDVMARFIDIASAFNCEIVDDELYLYSGKPFNLTNSTVVVNLISLVDQLTVKIDRQAARYKDDRANAGATTPDNVATATAQPGSNAIASPGKRLKRLPRFLYVIAYFVILALLIAAVVLAINFSKQNETLGPLLRIFASVGIMGIIASFIGIFKLWLQRKS